LPASVGVAFAGSGTIPKLPSFLHKFFEEISGIALAIVLAGRPSQEGHRRCHTVSG